MKFTLSAISALLAATAIAKPTPAADVKGTTLCGSFGSVAVGEFTLYQNNWGASKATSGGQCTTFKSLSADGSVVWASNWTWTGGAGQVKSYSNVALEKVNKKLTEIKSIKSTWKWTYTGDNLVADVAYDLWLAPSVGANNQFEIMVWLGSFGGAGPISSTYGADGNATPVATTTIAGTSWKLFKGPNGDTTVFSFVAPSNQGFNGDLKAFFDYLTSSQGVSTSSVVTSLQGGTEPFTGSGAVFDTTEYTLQVV